MADENGENSEHQCDPGAEHEGHKAEEDRVDFPVKVAQPPFNGPKAPIDLLVRAFEMGKTDFDSIHRHKDFPSSNRLTYGCAAGKKNHPHPITLMLRCPDITPGKD